MESTPRTATAADGDRLIVRVLQHYHPDWEPPRDTGSEWVSCLCPFHQDSRSSGSVSYVHDAFNCFVCDAKGDALKIIMREEGITYPEAIEFAKVISPGSSVQVLQQPPGKRSRRVFGEQGSTRREERVPPRGRRRPAPWS